MSISTEEKERYFQETAIALRREGFRIKPSVGGRLGVWLDDHPICEVDQIGGITYRSDNIRRNRAFRWEAWHDTAETLQQKRK